MQGRDKGLKAMLAEATGALLEAPTQLGNWNTLMQAMQRAVGAEVGGFAASDGRGVPALVLAGDQGFATDYVREYWALDPFSGPQAIAKPPPLNKSVCTEHLLSWQQLLKTPFYNDYWRRWGCLGQGIGARVETECGQSAQFVLLRSRRKAFGAEEHALIDELLPSLRNALALRYNSVSSLHTADLLSDDPLLLVSADSTLLEASAAAWQLMNHKPSLRIIEGRLQLGFPDRLPTLLGNAGARLPAQRQTLVPDPLADGKHHLLITACAGTGTPLGNSFLLRLRDIRALDQQFDHQDLNALFHFTTAQSRVANALLAGDDVESLARAWNIRKDSIRDHLKQMLRKTGTRNQRELVRLLSGALPLRTQRATCSRQATGT